MEVSPGTTTKFVTIIRLNKNLNEPKFYKLNLKKENDNYEFCKDEKTEIIGEEQIKKKIKEINEGLRGNNGLNYEELFYMLEIKKVYFIQEEFLERNDLVDVPGVSEYISNPKPNEKNLSAGKPIVEEKSLKITEEKLDSYKSENETNYLTKIFGIIKNKMKIGIFIFSVDKFHLIENYEIIGKLNSILDSPIQNFLFLLNKMDKSEDIEADKKDLYEKILQEFPSGKINPTKNTIIECSSFQLENELKMKENFSYLLHYHYINYIMGKNKNYNDFMEYFREYLKNHIEKLDEKYKNIEIEEFKNIIEEIIKDKNHNILNEVKKIIEKIQTNHDVSRFKLGIIEKYFDEESIEDSLNEIEEDNKIIISNLNDNLKILYYYYLFKNNQIVLHLSKETEKLINYFTMENYSKKREDQSLVEYINVLKNRETSLNDKINKALNEFENFDKAYNEELKNIEGYDKSKNNILNVLKSNKMFYIPLLGPYNAGKSTILNDFIGYKLLPTSNNECTKRGILVQNWDYDTPILRKTNFYIDEKNDICYFTTNSEIIAEGVENIKKILEGLNGNFIDNEKHFFYHINVKMNFKFLEYEFGQNLKEKICFIDLPGYGTKNTFEDKNIYSKLIRTCKMMIIILKEDFEEKNNIETINNIINKTSEFTGFPIETLIKKVLYIINVENKINIDELSLLNTKKSLIKNIDGLRNDNYLNYKNLNLELFNAKSYEIYLENKEYFKNINSFYHYTNEKYLIEKEQFYKGYRQNFDENFGNYFYKKLKNQFELTFNIKVKNKIIKDIKIKEEIEKTINSLNFKYSKEKLEEIKKLFTYGYLNIENSKFLSNSNYSSFISTLLLLIISSYDESVEELNIIKNNIFDLKPIFNYDKDEYIFEIKNDLQKSKESFIKEIEAIIRDIDSTLYNYDFSDFFDEYIESIEESLRIKKENIKKYLKNFDRETIQKYFEKKFKEKSDKLKTIFSKDIIDCSDKINNHYKSCFNLINQYKLCKKEEIEISELKIYISKKLGERINFIEVIDNLVNDIIQNSRNITLWINSKWYEWLQYKVFDDIFLNKTVDAMIEKSLEKLKKLKKLVLKAIKEYIEEMKKRITTHKNGCIEHLDRQIDLQNIENQKKIEDYKKKRKMRIKSGMKYVIVLKQ